MGSAPPGLHLIVHISMPFCGTAGIPSLSTGRARRLIPLSAFHSTSALFLTLFSLLLCHPPSPLCDALFYAAVYRCHCTPSHVMRVLQLRRQQTVSSRLPSSTEEGQLVYIAFPPFTLPSRLLSFAVVASARS